MNNDSKKKNYIFFFINEWANFQWQIVYDIYTSREANYMIY